MSGKGNGAGFENESGHIEDKVIPGNAPKLWDVS